MSITSHARSVMGEGEGNRAAVLLCVAIAIAILPIAMVNLPPLADYPNHLARVYILSNIGDIPDLAQYYRDVTSAQPNLAFDAIVAALALLMPLELAGRVFLGLTVIALIMGTVSLHRAVHGRFSLWPLISVFFVYNRLFLWGFAAYLFTLGCALGGFAAWIALRHRAAIRFPVATILATLLYLGHLYAFGVYALCIAGYELVALWDRRHDLWPAVGAAVSSGAQFLPAIYLFLFVSPTSDAVGVTRWGSVWRKLEAPANVIYNYNLLFDLACLAALIVLVAIGAFYRRVIFSRAMCGPLVLLALAFLAMPDQLFSSYGADRRIPIAFVLVAIGASDWRPGASRNVITGVLVTLFVVRTLVILQVWLKADRIYGEYLQAIDRLPQGAKLLVVIAHPSEESLPPIPVFEIANMAIIHRNAFVASLFTFPKDAGQAVAFSPEMQVLADVTPAHIVLPHTLLRLANKEYADRNGPFRSDLLSRYDFALVVNSGALPLASAPPNVEHVFNAKDFSLLRLTPVSDAGR